MVVSLRLHAGASNTESDYGIQEQDSPTHKWLGLQATLRLATEHKSKTAPTHKRLGFNWIWVEMSHNVWIFKHPQQWDAPLATPKIETSHLAIEK